MPLSWRPSRTMTAPMSFSRINLRANKMVSLGVTLMTPDTSECLDDKSCLTVLVCLSIASHLAIPFCRTRCHLYSAFGAFGERDRTPHPRAQGRIGGWYSNV